VNKVNNLIPFFLISQQTKTKNKKRKKKKKKKKKRDHLILY